jgi:voltage-gated potassium channel
MSAKLAEPSERISPDDWLLGRVGAALAPHALRIWNGRTMRRLRLLVAIAERENFSRLLAVALTLFLGSGVIVWALETQSEEPLITNIGEGLWYSIVTMASVGYGDYTPKTVAGRIYGGFLIFAGVTLFSFMSATIASILVAQRIREGRGLEAIKFKNHILMCGWNAYAERIIEGIAQAQGKTRSQLVLINQMPEDQVTELMLRIQDMVEARYVRGDPASEAVLERAAARDARSAIVLADASVTGVTASDERTTLVILALKGVKKELKVSAEALEIESEQHLKRAGADDLVVRGEFNGFLLSSSALAPGVPEVVRQVLALGESELRREPIPADLVGKTFREAFDGLRAKNGFMTVAIVTESKGLALDDLLTDDFSLVDNFIKEQFSAAGMEHLRFEEGGVRVTVNPMDDYIIGPSDTAIGIGLIWPTSTA